MVFFIRDINFSQNFTYSNFTQRILHQFFHMDCLFMNVLTNESSKEFFYATPVSSEKGYSKKYDHIAICFADNGIQTVYNLFLGQKQFHKLCKNSR